MEDVRERIDVERAVRRKRELVKAFGQEEPTRWVHHLADLDRGTSDVLESERPLLVHERAGRLADLLAGGVRNLPQFTNLPERELSPSRPYVTSPLSYLGAWSAWSLWPVDGSLEWAHWGGERRSGFMTFDWRNVAVGTQALVTIEVAAGATDGSGSIEVRSSHGQPRTFTAPGYATMTLDLLVAPTEPYGVLVTMEAMDDLNLLSFKRATYNTL